MLTLTCSNAAGEGCDEVVGQRVEEHSPDKGHVIGAAASFASRPASSTSRRLPCRHPAMESARQARAHIVVAAGAMHDCVPSRSARPGLRPADARQVRRSTHSRRVVGKESSLSTLRCRFIS